MKTTLHSLLSFLGLFLTLSLPSFADEWANLATISATTTTNHLCHYDGTDIVCAAPGSTVIISGDVSATTLNATQVCDETGANCKDVSGGWGNATSLNDADGNTLVEVEKNPNEDKVRITTGNTERAVIDASGLDVTGAVSASTNVSAPLVKLTPIAGSAGLDATITETDPSVGALTANKWCVANGSGDEIECTEDDPTANVDAVTVDGLDSTQFLRADADDTTTGRLTASALTVDTDTLYVDNAANEVGIGTNTPNAELHVDGALQIAGNTAGCSSAGDVGKIKFNSSIGRFQICRP